MYYWVAYDIGSNRTRRLAVKWCKQAGLMRVQRSVFAGRSTAGKIQELENLVLPLLSPDDSFCIVPIDRAAWQNLQMHGNNPSKDQITRSEPVKYF